MNTRYVVELRVDALDGPIRFELRLSEVFPWVRGRFAIYPEMAEMIDRFETGEGFLNLPERVYALLIYLNRLNCQVRYVGITHG